MIQFKELLQLLIRLLYNLSISTKEKDVKNMDGKTINRSSRSELITSKFCQQM